ncbi:hypothetical protein [Nocardia sp. NPDC051463]|uniref:hypothetical protein n=1 Tax=Nocardia sp. NPDC051463 TaxID=3154845 RepID=UPI0034480991
MPGSDAISAQLETPASFIFRPGQVYSMTLGEDEYTGRGGGAHFGSAVQVMFVGCEANATMVTVDLTARTTGDPTKVSETPDVLAYDQQSHRVYLAAESGWASVFDRGDGHTTVLGSKHLAEGAHSVALDPTTHHTFFPIPKGTNGNPALWECEPTS